MRKCPYCDTYTAHDSSTCNNCLTVDYGWQETLKAPIWTPPRQKDTSSKKHPGNRNNKQKHATLFDSSSSVQPITIRIRVGAFTDSSRYGFELRNIVELRKENSAPLEIVIDLRGLGHAWEYGAVCDPDIDVYLPPNLPLRPLVDAGRFIHVVENTISSITFALLLPPREHASTKFIRQTGIFSTVSRIEFDSAFYETSHMGSSDDVLIPMTIVNATTVGQLGDNFHDQYDRLAAAGRILPKHRKGIRDLIMESAENADSWGGGGYVAAFLRQEGRGQGGFHKKTNYDPIRDTHLFIHVCSLEGSLGTTLGCSEIEAVDAIRDGSSARANGVGLGMPFIISTVTQEALGTVFINSGGFTRVISPDGINRDFHSAGNDYLPGVHLCAVIPLACVADVSQALSPENFD